MHLKLLHHEYKYAVEQMMMVLFPEEKPDYAPAEPGADQAVSSLTVSATWATARTVLTRGGVQKPGVARVRTALLTEDLLRDRLLQRILKQSFYRAAVACTGTELPWGALTGIRPAKLMSRALKAEGSERRAVQYFQREFFVSPPRAQLALQAARASLAAENSLHPGELSLYIGIPFCPTRCAYCSFISADVQKALKLVEPYLDALLREVDAVAALLPQAGAKVRTIYIGGGTPTTPSAPQLRRLISHLREKLDLSALTEFTVEAGRPDTITAEKLSVLHELGVDRVSVNPQSMDAAVLRAMGRSHTPEDILRAYDLARQSGIPAVNMDLIAGLPQDSLAGFGRTLDTVLALHPENITVHTLALKRGARLMLEQQLLPSGDETAAMLDRAWSALRGAGYHPYYLYRQKHMSGALENVGWSTPGFDGLYNLCIMEELHTILALGAGGSTKLTDPATGRIVRITNPKYPQEYIQRIDDVCREKAALVPFQRALLAPETH